MRPEWISLPLLTPIKKANKDHKIEYERVKTNVAPVGGRKEEAMRNLEGSLPIPVRNTSAYAPMYV